MHPQQAGNTLALNPQFFCQQIDKKKTPFGKTKCFFIGGAKKIVALVSWRTTPVSICWSSELPQKRWHHSQQQKLVKPAPKSFSLSNYSQKPPFFAILMYSLYSQPRYFEVDISSLSENISNTTCVSGLSFYFLWL